jgi:small conductance mechanosensitive channel
VFSLAFIAPNPATTPSPSTSPGLPDYVSEIAKQAQQTCGQQGDPICSAVRSWLPNENWAPLVASLITVVVIVLIALVVRNLTHRLIDRVTRRAAEGVMPERLRRTAGEGGHPTVLTERRRQRAETMGSVLRHLASVIILGTAALMALGRLGIDIAPLLTSVGILGVAVGFGAQELVKDFISGMFMLLEDQYGVGDVIDTGTAVGTVEAVTLRITRLRDVDGKVWYVRNGTISRIGNESQGWSRALLDVPVPYDADIEAIRDLLKDVATGVWQDPDFHDLVIVEEPQVYGLEQMSGSALIFRVTAKTVPGGQGPAARELRLRVKRAFDEKGLAFASVTTP